ncbi:VOC family protein [Gloeobacter violaceus]|uniref:Gll2143 protein n=1 Tax=Gloeobacter violaceus (strain ATCC 29082 / PCC 7421) TaxID=251221 RepID=Q7NIP0_GLOVI|nr:VOC family protein [Gloeobacter violaceus]BAC90084.1 gll2143 [Gloeobacter violaceus PCC 7421]
MFDHISVGIRDLEVSIAFYDAALASLGCQRAFRFPKGAAYGPSGRPVFWLHYQPEAAVQAVQGNHLAFQANSRTHVDAFYRTALAAGGKDDGPPGPRPHYHPNYYAAFVIDPDGHRLEAVCHSPG